MKRYLLANAEIDTRLASREGFSWGDARILDATGFLIHSELFDWLKTLPKVAEEGNAILVAEGGMGKSFILEEFANGDPENVEKINLVLFEDCPQELQKELEAKSSHRKCLLLDGLDEAPRLSKTLIRCLQQPGFSSRVIIASRGIPELKAVCDCLKWPVYSLLPYTKDDVRARCEEEKKDFEAFLRAVEGIGLGAVCARPLGCNLLLDSFENGKLSATSSEDLWERSLLRHCSENDKSETRSLTKQGATPRECWNIACRVALALKLAGRSVLPRISAFPEAGEIDVERLFSAEDRDKYNECLCRPLYVSICQDKYRFSHSTYFDFMAAMGLVELVDRSSWAKFVLSPEGIPYPQWEGVIPWLAVRDDEILERVKSVRPDLLLGSDAVVARIGKEEVCRCILGNAESIPRTIRSNPAIQARYFALSTDECVHVVADALRNGSSDAVVDTAIDIVHRTRVPAMVDALVEFFCDGTKDPSLRVSAGYVLHELADEDQRKRCRAALTPDLPKRMKEVLLPLLWPRNITATELIPMLDDEADQDRDLFWFVDTIPATFSSLPESDVLKLLEWAVEEIKKDEFAEHALFDAKAAVFCHCWQLPFTRRSILLLAKGLDAYAKIYRSPFEGSRYSFGHKNKGYGDANFAADVEKRRNMARYLAESGEFSLTDVTHWPIQLLRSDDIDFVLDQIKASDDLTRRERWAQCLKWLAGGIELPKRNDVWDWLHAEFPTLFKQNAKSELKGRRAFKHKQESRERTWNKKSESRNRETAEIRARNAIWVHEHLQSRPTSDTFAKAMWAVYQTIPSEKRGFGLDFRKSELWLSFSQKEIDFLVSAVPDFMLTYNGPISAQNSYHPICLQAFYLLMAYDEHRLENLPPAVWRKFSPELLQLLDHDSFDLVLQTMKCFAKCQPDVFVEELSKRLKTQLAEGGILWLHGFKEVLDDKLTVRLLSSLVDERLSEVQKPVVFLAFWDIAPELTAEYINASDLSTLPLDGCCTPLSAFLIASELNRRFPELLRLLSEKPEWGHKWAEIVLGQYTLRGLVSVFWKDLSVDELKEFYAWLIGQFPPEDRPEHVGAYTPSELDNVYDAISNVFHELISRIDENLPQALHELQLQFPRLWYLHEYELEAKRKLLEKHCPTYDMDTILKVLDKRTSIGIVDTPEDLLNLVLAVLDRYQTYLQSVENPRIRDLWNVSKKDVSHKNESSLTNHLKSFLDRELPDIVFNREVLLNDGTTETRGSQTDLWITAISKQDKTRVRLCIEVKGDWNPEWKTAFRDQLCLRYMGRGGADAGIFLVGWFGSGKKPADNRKRIHNKDAAAQLLEKQQAELVQERFLVRHLVLDCTY